MYSNNDIKEKELNVLCALASSNMPYVYSNRHNNAKIYRELILKRYEQKGGKTGSFKKWNKYRDYHILIEKNVDIFENFITIWLDRRK